MNTYNRSLNTVHLLSAFVLALFSPLKSLGVTIFIQDQLYSITDEYTSLYNSPQLFSSAQPWWHDQSVAIQAARDYQSQDQSNPNNGYGLFFAFDVNSISTVRVEAWSPSADQPVMISLSSFNNNNIREWHFAQALLISTPDTMFTFPLVLLAFSAFIGLRRKFDLS